MNNNILTIGLIKGRHEMPVENYIFTEAISNVHDYKAIRSHIVDFLETQVGICVCTGIGVDQVSYEDIQVFRGEKSLVVYVTGLTPVTAELVAACFRNGVRLTLMNFDSATGNYVPQRML